MIDVGTALRKLLRGGWNKVPASVLILLLGFAFLAPVVGLADPAVVNPAIRLEGPSQSHWLGTDELGRDLLSRLAYGSRLTFLIALPAVLLAGAAGTAMGLVAGHFGGMVSLVIMRVVDLMLSFPPIILGIFIVAMLGPSSWNIVLVIGILYAPHFARVVQGSVLKTREMPYIEAASSLAAGDGRIMLRHILPNTWSVIIVQSSIALGVAVLLESSLSFLGLGPPPPYPSLGRMVSAARSYMHVQPLYVIWPSVIVALIILAANLLGDSIRDVQDPRSSKKL